MNMTFTDILETLKHSINFEEFQISYNELIPDISKAKQRESINEWSKFIRKKNELKKGFYVEYCNEYPNNYIRKLREAYYIYDIDISNEILEIENIFKQIQRAQNFSKRLQQLQ